jgi:hypothetical protein
VLRLLLALFLTVPAAAQPALPSYLFRDDPSSYDAACEREGTLAVFAAEARTGGGTARGTVPDEPAVFVCTSPGALGEAEWTRVTGVMADGAVVESDLNVVDAAADEECLTYESTVGDFEWQPCETPTTTVKRVSADQSSTSTSFADVTDLTFPVLDAEIYTFACEIMYSTAVNTTALQLSITGPIATVDYDTLVYTGTSAVLASYQNAYDTATNPATSGGATILPARITGSINPLADGTLAVRLATEVGGSSVTVKRGSFCTLYGQ